MGLRDVLFGKKKLAGPARERLFALTTAAVTLDTELGLKTAGVGGVVFKPLSAGEFVRAENELQELLEKVTQENGTKIERSTDSYGFEWLVLRDPDVVSVASFVGAGTVTPTMNAGRLYINLKRRNQRSAFCLRGTCTSGR